jgi:selenocysteine lyase/cysteine desulfurase
LYPQHKYVAQKYVWPPLLYGGKKFHVRVYATITYDGRAFVHRRAFLHVANEPFNVTTSGRGGEEMYDDTVHITNCCANSHDDRKFAGEILADFEESEFTTRQEEESATTAPVQAVVPLAEFFPSVKATVSEVARRAFPFLDGGQKNNGFEYCGLDFILSYKSVTAVACGNNKIKTTDCRDGVIPVAYLLEINAPPSQDTATGLLHAENLHNQVLKDWIDYWVVPRVTNKNLASSNTKAMDTAPLGGWRCVYEPTTTTASNDADSCMDSDPILPSKAAILNKIRWALFEKKMSKIDLENMATEEEGNIQHEQQRNGTRQCKLNAWIVAEKVSQFARTQFPFFTFSEPQSLQARQKLASRTNSTVFFESAGGSQVSQAVIDSMNSSLCFRHRSVVGSATKTMARKTAKILFGALQSSVVFGANATSLFSALAQTYLRYNLLSSNDEVVVSTENHRANFDPWTEAAARVGATIKYWTPNAKFCPSSTNRNDNSSADLDDLITTRTRIVAISHVSNILGLINPIAKWTEKIKSRSSGRAHVVVDGVAAVPHVFAAFDNLGVDWYVVSMHKMFGPHLGILLAAKGRAMDQVVASSGNSPGDNDTCLSSLLESGTSNLEGCAGVLGVAAYLNRLAESENGLLAKHWSTVNMSGCVTSTGEGNCHNAIDLGNDIARMLTTETVKAAYRLIRTAEIPIVDALFCGLSRSKNVRILGRAPSSMKSSSQKVPTFSFVHDTIPSRQIVMFCEERGIMCRHGYFLCTERLAGELHIITSCSNNTNTTKNASKSDDDGVVRFSLVHYNTVSEVEYALSIIESMPGW